MSDTDDEVLAAAEACANKWRVVGGRVDAEHTLEAAAIARRLQAENARLQVEVERALKHERLTYLSEREQLAKRLRAEDAATKAEAEAAELAAENDKLRTLISEAICVHRCVEGNFENRDECVQCDAAWPCETVHILEPGIIVGR